MSQYKPHAVSLCLAVVPRGHMRRILEPASTAVRCAHFMCPMTVPACPRDMAQLPHRLWFDGGCACANAVMRGDALVAAGISWR